MNRVRTDKEFKKLVLKYPLITENRVNLNGYSKDDAKIIRQMYDFKGVNLLTMIPSYKREAMPLRFDSGSEFKIYSADFAFAIEQEIAEKNTKIKKKIEYLVVKAEDKKQPKSPKRHLSVPQYIDLPNFREPILMAAKGDDYLKILQCIRDFEQMPQVLKGCNTEAQREYLKEHPEIVSKYVQIQKQK